MIPPEWPDLVPKLPEPMGLPSRASYGCLRGHYRRGKQFGPLWTKVKHRKMIVVKKEKNESQIKQMILNTNRREKEKSLGCQFKTWKIHTLTPTITERRPEWNKWNNANEKKTKKLNIYVLDSKKQVSGGGELRMMLCSSFKNRESLEPAGKRSMMETYLASSLFGEKKFKKRYIEEICVDDLRKWQKNGNTTTSIS